MDTHVVPGNIIFGSWTPMRRGIWGSESLVCSDAAYCEITMARVCLTGPFFWSHGVRCPIYCSLETAAKPTEPCCLTVTKQNKMILWRPSVDVDAFASCNLTQMSDLYLTLTCWFLDREHLISCSVTSTISSTKVRRNSIHWLCTSDKSLAKIRQQILEISRKHKNLGCIRSCCDLDLWPFDPKI